MAANPAYLYQMYETFLMRAREAELAGAKDQARKLYLHASQSLLEVAKTNTGEIKETQLKNVQLLIEKAKTLENGVADARITPGKATVGQGKGPFQAEAVPDVSFDDIAGLEDVKREVTDRIIQPLRKPDIYRQFGISPGGGILMFGLPGTGKTMIARAIAKEVNAPFYFVNSSDLKDKWVGSSERNIAALFDQVRQEKAAVVFMDEFDGIGGKAGQDSNSSSRSFLAELKSQIDGFDKNTDSVLLLLAATNKPWDIDTAFLRSGRFSTMLYVPLPDEAARRFLIERHLFANPHDGDIDIEQIIQRTEGFNGSDVVAVCIKAKMMAVNRSLVADQLSNVTNGDVLLVLEKARSTVSAADVNAMIAYMRENNFTIPQYM